MYIYNKKAQKRIYSHPGENEMAIKVSIWKQTPAGKIFVRGRQSFDVLRNLEQRIAVCVAAHIVQYRLDERHARVADSFVRPVSVAKQLPLTGFDLVNEGGNIF